jgi:hypothetical protein
VKKSAIASILFLFLQINTFGQTDSMDGRKHYPIQSCQIVFRFFNGPQSGTKTVTFDEWGNKEKTEIVMSTDTAVMRKWLAALQDSTSPAETRAFLNNIPITAEQHLLTISLESQRYNINLDQKVGSRGTVFLIGGSFEENLKQTGFAFMRNDTLLGKPCKVWEMHGGFRFWVWNNYVVKKQMITDLPQGMRIEEYAVKIDESYSIRPDEFKIPDNIQFQ